MNAPLKNNILEYKKRIHKALDYIRENLDKPITLTDVARASCFSEFHFHRIFSSLMNETVGEYVTRKKLERAAVKLAYSANASVTDMAVECGYASVSSFSKAFNRWFGCRPTEITQIKSRLDAGTGKLQTKYNKSIESDQLFVNATSEQFEAIDKKVQIRITNDINAVYLTCPNGYDIPSIHKTWMALHDILQDANVDITQCDRFAISHDHPGLTPESHCRYDACMTVPNAVRAKIELPETVIPGGRYAIYPVSGPEESILSQYLEFYTVWMPQSGYEPDNFPVVEHYLPSCRPGQLDVELWAKIKRLSFSQ